MIPEKVTHLKKPTTYSRLWGSVHLVSEGKNLVYQFLTHFASIRIPGV